MNKKATRLKFDVVKGTEFASILVGLNIGVGLHFSPHGNIICG